MEAGSQHAGLPSANADLARHTVWKYQLVMEDRQTIRMPKGAVCLHVDQQHGALCLWMHVDPEAEPEERVFALVGTGHMAPSLDYATYLGTVQSSGGIFVWHVFETVLT